MVKEFLKSQIFYKNLALSFVGFIVIIILTALILNIYTRHGSEKPLPSFVGMDLSHVAEVMADLDLRYEVSDSIFDIKMSPGRIYDQHPAAGSMVKKERMIQLSVFSSTPVLAEVPDLKDQSVRNAQGELLENGFSIGKISYIPSEFTNLVLEQKFNGKTVSPGFKLPKGSAIDLVIGKNGSADRTKIPDLSGLSIKEAKSYAQGIMLNIGSVLYDNTITSEADTIKAVVFKQSPVASDSYTLPLGSSIDVWLTTDYTKIQ